MDYVKCHMNDKKMFRLTFLAVLVLTLATACHRKIDTEHIEKVDAVLIGGGIMSATLGSLLTELDPNMHINVYERLNEVALESSAAWNNAGTGHASYAELNYTPEVDGKVDIKKAINVNGAFEESKQYWAHLVLHKKIGNPHTFINTVPHMSFVWGDKNVAFLKKRFDALKEHPFFTGMEYSDNPDKIREWAPLIMEGRDPQQKVAATRMSGGTDVNFGALTKELFTFMTASGANKLFLKHEVTNLRKAEDGSWNVFVRNLADDKTNIVNAKFVFIGAGGDALMLLQKSGIEEAKGFGGFPVGGAWLVTDNENLIKQHMAKVYGQASVGSPPMSVPHLDTRFINGKRALLFGPFATFSTKFLKTGLWTDLFASLNTSNIVPVVEVGVKNFDLITYLAGQVLMTENQRVKSLREYFPAAKNEDWHISYAGQRVQVIKKDPEKGGVLQFGTELVGSKDGSVMALLGASPGASTAVKAMVDVLKRSFKDKMATPAWKHKLHEMIPSYKSNLENEEVLKKIREHNDKMLNLKPAGFLTPDLTR